MIRGHLNLHPNSTTLTDVTQPSVDTDTPDAMQMLAAVRIRA